MEVYLGKTKYIFPSNQLSELEDHTQLFDENNWVDLRDKLKDTGYLRIRNLIDRQTVVNARSAVLNYVNDTGEHKFDPRYPLESGILDSRCGRGCLPFMEGSNDVTNDEDVKKVIEGKEPKAFFENLLDDEVITFDWKWLRGVYKVKYEKVLTVLIEIVKDAFTGVHVDNVYMGRGTSELFTMWIPIGDISVDMGTLAMVPGSHKDQAFTKFQVLVCVTKDIYNH